jgi:repressor LexA
MPRLKERRPITPRQRDTLAAIVAHIEWHGYPPTIRELCRKLGVKPPGWMPQHLAKLELNGWISRSKGTPRGIRVLRRPDGTPA